MAAIKCQSCKRWTLKDGCAIEAESYYRFKLCVLDKADFYIPKITEEENSADLRRKNEEVSR